MSTFSLAKKNIIDYLYPIIIIIFSFLINWNYSKHGVFPMDTFLQYDSAYKILNGEYPIRDYWVVSGIFVDILQSIFFRIFGVNWHAYIAHSSLLNSIICILTFYILIEFELKKHVAFFYAISFALLAYTISGTPFLDLHATFFSLIAIYLTFSAIKNPEKKLSWFLIVLFYYISFLSKQVPAAYLVIINILIILPYLLINKYFKSIAIIVFTTIFFVFLTLLILKITNTNYSLFSIQYLEYPRSIGSERYNNFNISIETTFNNYKFILAPLLILSYIKIKKIFNKKIIFYSIEFTIFLILLSFSLCLIFHQLLTKNQIYIYFLIPLNLAFLQIEFKKFNIKLKFFFTCLTMFLLFFSSAKYHVRFNETRKFHELENTDLSRYVDASTLDKSLKGNLWISSHYKGNPKNEIAMLKKIKKEIDKKPNEIMLITHYLFLDSMTAKKLNSPSRTHTLDGASIPTINNKYFDYYKNYFKSKIIKQNIEEVYFIKDEKISTKVFTNIFSKNCYTRYEDDLFIFFLIDRKCLN